MFKIRPRSSDTLLVIDEDYAQAPVGTVVSDVSDPSFVFCKHKDNMWQGLHNDCYTNRNMESYTVRVLRWGLTYD